MRLSIRKTGSFALLTCALTLALLLGWSGLALAQGAKLYELTENMAFVGPHGQGVINRIAIAALQGSAKVGTPLCPSGAVTNAQTCTVTAVGNDSVDVSTGLGKVWGTYAVVVQGDNQYDGPEFVLQTGSFSGDIDLSPAVLAGIPLGSITNGTFTIDGVRNPIRFSGTFRLPFALSPTGQHTTPQPGKNAYYLADNGMLIKVSQDELSLGFPTVRFEVTFEE